MSRAVVFVDGAPRGVRTFSVRGGLTLGTNTRQSVPVVQNKMKDEMMMKDASCLSDSTKEMAAPMTHMMTTLYTDMPTYLESLSAGMLTWRVSHARKAPKICNRECNMREHQTAPHCKARADVPAIRRVHHDG